MPNKSLEFCRKNSRTIIVVCISLLAVLGVLSFIRAGNISRKALEEQTLHRQQVVARAGKIALESFISYLGGSLVEVEDDNLINNPEVTIEDFYKSWKNTPVAGALVANTKGDVVFASGKAVNTAPHISIAYRDYYSWALTAKLGEVFMGKPIKSMLNPKEMGLVVALSTPIYKNNTLKGVVAASISISDLAQKYFEPIKLTDDTKIYLLDNDGEIVYSPISSLIGDNYFDILKNRNFKGRDLSIDFVSQALKNPGEGKFIADLPNENTGQLTRYLVSYSPVYFNGKKVWTLGVASPESVAGDFLIPFYENQDRTLIGFIATLVFLGIVGTTLVRIHEKEGGKKNV